MRVTAVGMPMGHQVCPTSFDKHHTIGTRRCHVRFHVSYTEK